MGKAGVSRLASVSNPRRTLTSSANLTVESEPAPMKPSPIWAVRLSALGWWAPNQSGGGGVFPGVGAPARVGGVEKSPPQGGGGSLPRGVLPPRPPPQRPARRPPPRPPDRLEPRARPPP